MRRAAVAASLVALAVPAASVASGGQLQAAITVAKSKGYCVYSTHTWEPSFKLNVLIGTYAKSADGYNQRAFFFYAGRYLGTDASTPSAQLQEMWRDDRTIALMYVLYRGSDPLCCPTGGGAIVRFRWNGSKLVAMDRIPTSDFHALLHR